MKNDTLLLTISLEDVDELSAVERLLPNTAFTYRVEGKSIEVYKMQQAAQGKFTLQGVVKDKTGETVPFATLQIKGTTQGTTADADGKFAMPVNQETGNVTVSSVGYETKTLRYTAGKAMNIVLSASAYTIGEVSVIAYGKRNTREQVGAITSVKAEDLQRHLRQALKICCKGACRALMSPTCRVRPVVVVRASPFAVLVRSISKASTTAALCS